MLASVYICVHELESCFEMSCKNVGIGYHYRVFLVMPIP